MKGPTPDPREAPEVGRFNRFLGGRLLMAGLVSGSAGLALLVFAAIKVWLAVSRNRLGPDAIPVAVAAILALALLSLSRSARRTGLRYLSGDRSLSRDAGRFVAGRLARRRRRRRS